MKLILIKDKPDLSKKLVLVFGSGIVGKQIVSSIVFKHTVIMYDYQYLWNSTEKESKGQLVSLECFILKVLEMNNIILPQVSLSIVWAAGKAGFFSNNDDVEKELCNFAKLILFFERIEKSSKIAKVSFFLMSSAGALFEGMGYITNETKPRPFRAYGFLKLKQENILLTSKLENCYIYRLTSVYGQFSTGDRSNLVSALITAGLRREVCHIFGQMNTLRDYVSSTDIGAFIETEIFSQQPQASARVLILASLKPSTILEIKHEIEMILMRRIYIEIDPDPGNMLDISYSKSCIPDNIWNTTDLKVNLRSIVLNNKN